MMTRPGMRRCYPDTPDNLCSRLPQNLQIKEKDENGDDIVCCYSDTVPGRSRGIVQDALIANNQVFQGNCPSPGPEPADCESIEGKKKCNKADGCAWYTGDGNVEPHCRIDDSPSESNSQVKAGTAEKDQSNSGAITAAASAVMSMAMVFYLI